MPQATREKDKPAASPGSVVGPETVAEEELGAAEAQTSSISIGADEKPSGSSIPANRSRLSTFNLSLFNNGLPKKAHKRRSSIGKILKTLPTLMQDNSVSPERTVPEVVIIDETDNTIVDSTNNAETSYDSNELSGGFSPRNRNSTELTLTFPEKLRPLKGSVGDEDLLNVDALRQTERGLISLLGDFFAGRLKVFGDEDTFNNLKQVRELQERLARSHFDMHQKQNDVGFANVKQPGLAAETLTTLMENLAVLKQSMESLRNVEAPDRSRKRASTTGSESVQETTHNGQ